jgi:hypothetical protein
MGTPIQGPASGQFLRFGQLLISKSTPATPTTTSLGATSLGQVDGITTFQTGISETPNTSFGIDLSQLRFRFEVRASDVETPNTLVVRVYNAAQQTVNSITKEFDTVTLTAGYQNGNKGTIFQGNIKQTFEGRERNVDRYLDIMAGDGDIAYTQGVVNQTFPANTTTAQEFAAYVASVASTGLTAAVSAPGILNETGGTNPKNLRGKTVFGMFRLAMGDLAQRVNARWSIQNGVVTLIPITGYLPGQAVQINSATGMIGTPEQTEGGIMIRCYLNPLIRIGQLVQINQGDINQNTLNKQMFPSYTSQFYPATTTHDGFYRVLVHEMNGDTRGNEWYSELTCLAADISSPVATAVQSNG